MEEWEFVGSLLQINKHFISRKVSKEHPVFSLLLLQEANYCQQIEETEVDPTVVKSK